MHLTINTTDSGAVKLNDILLGGVIAHRPHRNSIDLHGIISRDYKIRSAVDHARLHKIGTFRLDLNDNIRSFNLEFAGVDDIGDVQ